MAFLVKRGKTYYADWNDRGKRRRTSLECGNERKARELLKEYEIKELAAQPVSRVQSTEATLESLLTLFAAWGQTHLRPSTLAGYRYAVSHWKAAKLPMALRDITRGNVERFKDTRRDAGKSVRTVNLELTYLKGLVTRATKQGWYHDQNPFANVAHLPEPEKTARWLTAAQSEAVLTAARAVSYDCEMFCALGIFAGLRKNEILACRWDWFDFANGTIRVSNDPARHFLTKSGRERTIPLHSRLREIVSASYDIHGGGYLIAPDNPPVAKGYRFDIRKQLTRAFTAAGVPWATPHTLRHTFASQLVIAGVSLYKIQKWLGHVDASTTMIYAHLAPQDSEIEAIGGTRAPGGNVVQFPGTGKR